MLDDIALEIGRLVIGGIILVAWVGGALKISDWNQNLGVVWFVGWPVLTIAVIVFNA